MPRILTNDELANIQDNRQNDLANVIGDVLEANNALADFAEQAIYDLEVTEHALNDREIDCCSLSAELNDTADKNKSLQTDLTASYEQRDYMEKRLDHLREERDYYKDRAAKLEADLAHLDLKCVELEKEAQRDKVQLEDQGKTIAAFEQGRDQLAVDREALEYQYVELDDAWSNYYKQENNLTARFAKLDKERLDLTKRQLSFNKERDEFYKVKETN